MKKMKRRISLLLMVLLLFTCVPATAMADVQTGTNKTIVGIEIIKPDKLEYYWGEPLELTGGKVREVYSDGTTGDNVNLTSREVTGYNSYYVGTQPLTVTYKGMSASFMVKVKRRAEVVGIQITAPDKLVYNYGDDLDLTGGEVREVYTGGATGIGIDMTSTKVTATGYNPYHVGPQTITIKYMGISATFNVTVTNKVKELEITKPDKLEYNYGDDLDLTGGKVREVYHTGYKGNYVPMTKISGVTVSGYNPIKLGEQTLRVEYKGNTAYFNVTVTDPIRGLEITAPDKLVYNYGETLDLTGGKVREVRADGSKGNYISMNDSQVKVQGYNPYNTNESQPVTVTYKGKTASFNVWVNSRDNEIVGLLIMSSKILNFNYGEELDLTGVRIQERYFNGRYGALVNMKGNPDVTVTGYNKNQVGKQSLTATYKGQTTTFDVTVNDTVVSVEIAEPDKLEYNRGEALNLAGGTVREVYASGSKGIDVGMATNGVTVTGYDPNTVGTQTVTVTYKGKTATFNVTVTDNDKVTLSPSEASFVQRTSNGKGLKQTPTGNLAVKENGSNGANTRYAYVTYDLSELKTMLQETGREIKSVTLKYSAYVTKANVSRTLNINKVVRETSWSNWSNKPVMSTQLGRKAFNGTTPTAGTLTVTDYVKERLAGNSVTFGFTCSACNGEMMYIPLGSRMPELVIETREAVVLSSVQVNDLPKTTYIKGENLNISTGSIKAIYSDGSSQIKSMNDSGVTVTGYDKNKVGEQTLTVNYQGKTATFKVTVVEREQLVVESIEVVNLSKPTYFKGEDVIGWCGPIKVTYTNGSSEIKSMADRGVTVTGYNKNRVGDQTLTVNYQGKKATFIVTVVEKQVTKIKIYTTPSKTTYKKNEAITFARGYIKLVYNDGTESGIISMNPKTPNGVTRGTTRAMNKAGKQLVVVNYKDSKTGKTFTARYTITVK